MPEKLTDEELTELIERLMKRKKEEQQLVTAELTAIIDELLMRRHRLETQRLNDTG